jgi:ribosomal protein S18 acetylase RimI-like enzyme
VKVRDLKTTVSPVTSDEVAQISAIWLDMMQMHQRTDRCFKLAVDAKKRWESMTVDMVSRNDSFVFGAQQGGRFVGFCIGWIARNPPIYDEPEVGFVSELAVSNEARRQGVGRALMSAARRWFAVRGLQEFQLSTAVWNNDAQEFWRAIGGKPLLIRYRFDT